jgi:tRNA-dihydrouridine synthase A
VQNGAFGACLMATPDVVAEAVAAMRSAVRVPVTVKHRIGIDDQDSYEELHHFVSTVAAAGCETFIVHARKAILKGLSPKQNREIPPLRYEVVQQLKRDFPALTVVLNGGVKSLADSAEHLSWADGVMIGREAYQHPYLLAGVDRLIFGEDVLPPTRREVLEAYLPYVEEQLAHDVYLSHLTRHILGLFAGQSGARHWKRTLSERSHLPGAGVEVIRDAVAGIPDGALDAQNMTVEPFALV